MRVDRITTLTLSTIPLITSSVSDSQNHRESAKKIQHNPNAPTGRDATMAFLGNAGAANPELTHDVKRVIHGEEKDGEGLVAVHHHFRRTSGERGWAVVDIMRIKDGYVVEHWDVMQPVPDPAASKNANGMF